MAATIAVADGCGRGFEIPNPITSIVVAAVCLLGMISIAMRIVDHAATELHAQLAKLVADEFALIVSGVDAKVQSNNRKIQTMLQTTIKAEVAVAVKDATGHAYRVGMVRNAELAAELGATLHRIPSRHEG